MHTFAIFICRLWYSKIKTCEDVLLNSLKYRGMSNCWLTNWIKPREDRSKLAMKTACYDSRREN